MSVYFRSSSGNREDATPQVPSSGTKQPLIDTATSGSVPSTVLLQKARHPHAETATPDFMPTGANFPESGTDIADPTATQGGNSGVFFVAKE